MVLRHLLGIPFGTGELSECPYQDYFQNGIRTTGKEKKNKANLQNKDKVKDELSEIFVKRSYTVKIRCLIGSGLPRNKSKRGKYHLPGAHTVHR